MGSTLIKFLMGSGISGSILMLAVILLRFPLKRSAKSATLVLWGLVALRLIIPFSIQTESSIVPNRTDVARGFESAFVINAPAAEESTRQFGQAASDVPYDVGETAQTGETAPQNVRRTEKALTVSDILALIWACGALAIAGHTFVSYLKLRRNVSASIEIEKNVFICDYISTSFAMGIFRPKIYIPSSLNEENIQYVIAHEKEHIRHKDIPIKLIGHTLLTVYWFNPLAWVSYILFCRDIEFACDERTVKNYEKSEKAGYAQTLLDCKLHRGAAMTYPVAFGDTAIKERVKKVLNYKKPAVWITVICLILCAALTAFVLTEAKDDRTGKYVTEGYSAEEIRYEMNSMNPDLNSEQSEESLKENAGKMVSLFSKIAGGDTNEAKAYAALLQEITGHSFYDLDENPSLVFAYAEECAEYADAVASDGKSAIGLRGISYDAAGKRIVIEQYGFDRFDLLNMPQSSKVLTSPDGALLTDGDDGLGKYRVEIMAVCRMNGIISKQFAEKHAENTTYEVPGSDGKIKMRYALIDGKLLNLYFGCDDPMYVEGLPVIGPDTSKIAEFSTNKWSQVTPFAFKVSEYGPEDDGVRGLEYNPKENELIVEQFGLNRFCVRNLREDARVNAPELGKYRIEFVLTKAVINNASVSRGISEKFAAGYESGKVYELPGSDGKIKFSYYTMSGESEVYIYLGSDEPLYAVGTQFDEEKGGEPAMFGNDPTKDQHFALTFDEQHLDYGFNEGVDAE